ncbi:hypothetical protein U9J35_21165 [Rossellomorea aquimaris]|nr:hypothetical protein [Rossellomorea aquimaris]WRP06331.1 hypothetical protein U9J35_21165 [Rossellomorea aquimaris]
MKKFIGLLILIFLITGCLTGCSDSDGTPSDEAGDILSRDDAEVLVYNELSEEDKQTYTIDFYKEEGTKYYIRVYEEVNGEINVRENYTVDFHTEEIKRID